MIRLALCLLLLATGASASELPRGVWSFEDKPRGVVCYVMNSALSCVNVWLPQVAGKERQLSPHETQPEPTPALAPGRWIDERYEL
ncbi:MULTISPECIES: hypothetical protein [Pseudomonas]|jgi:hypothetical protein|uniref:Uncharacterized protein n=1 Tax=Pseudomonas putida (strain ATCC 47054 / DSM 6125 / CFBP 8728 / NCIMB 11950 / KT2440) TaxID=160488 RepID=A0A140FW23_PSEPK|nr:MULTISPECIES: hypothetical protein [Pseudomonas]AMM02806.1 conserved exported protein of unknown function [Pseudomonas putida KT2440]KMU95664.1 hypothetical protein AC138_13670 [Pseudomonas putida]KMY36347.1 hypothetical protein AA993_07910 [Pseudomonas putida]MDD2078618.1 hypothetical protein [Pseudomonas putida]PXZ52388.1 hypothetical protein DM483_06675 [Pseudomonas sp. SMT-1]